MISTLERDNSIEGILFRKMKELPDWYGLTGVGFIWHGEWNDPEIEYKGKRINATIVEDTMWERWIRDDDGRLIDGRESDDDGFKKRITKGQEKSCSLFFMKRRTCDVTVWRKIRFRQKSLGRNRHIYE